jgi:hypothetical protein
MAKVTVESVDNGWIVTEDGTFSRTSVHSDLAEVLRKVAVIVSTLRDHADQFPVGAWVVIKTPPETGQVEGVEA